MSFFVELLELLLELFFVPFFVLFFEEVSFVLFVPLVLFFVLFVPLVLFFELFLVLFFSSYSSKKFFAIVVCLLFITFSLQD